MTYYQELGIRVRYLHSEIATIERTEILRDLRQGEFDVLIGINLLREGLNLPEVSLVAILDADKEGFLRSARSLIQTIGRAARNVRGKVLLYADRETRSIAEAVGETTRRRAAQTAYNRENGITPQSVEANISSLSDSLYEADYVTVPVAADDDIDLLEVPKEVERLRKEMRQAAEDLDYERAAVLRDRIRELEEKALMQGFDAPAAVGRDPAKAGRGRRRGGSRRRR